MPKKIRELKSLLKKAGFIYRSAKGSHTRWYHPLLPEDPITISGKDEREVEIRVVAFCDIQTKSELRLATNLLKEEEEQVINQEIMEIYIQISSGKF